MLKNVTFAATLSVSTACAAIAAEPVRIGLLFGFTGPIESMAPKIAASAELALSEASQSGLFLDGRTIEPVRADSTCIDATLAVAAAERLVTSERVSALIGADCSGAASAVAAQVAVPNGVLSISPTATSPGLTDLEDNGLFFRTAPSDARQGQVLAEILISKGIGKVAVTYTSNDYGKGLASSFAAAFKDMGGRVAVELAHADGKSDYSAEIGALAASGAEVLIVAGYADQGGRAILQAALDLGAFDRFVLPDGMVADSILEEFGSEIEGSIGTLPGGTGNMAERFEAMLNENGIRGQAPYRAEAYDAAAVLVLAMQLAGATEGGALTSAMHQVANAPGVPIGPGEIALGLQIISEGGDINYVGASSVEFTEEGDAAGSYREVIVNGATFETINVW